MLIRFVAHDTLDEDSHAPIGVFAASKELRERMDLSTEDLRTLESLRDWFNEHLEEPARFNRSRRPNRTPKAISWFKETAHEHLDRVRSIVAILRQHGYAIREVRTRRPGYIVYEDEYQVVAEPFRDTRR